MEAVTSGGHDPHMDDFDPWARRPSDTDSSPWREGHRCTVCGDWLHGDKDDDPTHPTGPMCGDCYRARAFDDQLWETGGPDGTGGIW